MPRASAWIGAIVCAVSGLWFCGKTLDYFGGWIDSVGAQMCRIVLGAGLFIVVPCLIILFIPKLVTMSFLERMLMIWISMLTISDIAMTMKYSGI